MFRVFHSCFLTRSYGLVEFLGVLPVVERAPPLGYDHRAPGSEVQGRDRHGRPAVGPLQEEGVLGLDHVPHYEEGREGEESDFVSVWISHDRARAGDCGVFSASLGYPYIGVVLYPGMD